MALNERRAPGSESGHPDWNATSDPNNDFEQQAPLEKKGVASPDGHNEVNQAQMEYAQELLTRFGNLMRQYPHFDTEITPLFNISQNRFTMVLQGLKEGRASALNKPPMFFDNDDLSDPDLIVSKADLQTDGRFDVARALVTFEKVVSQMERLVEDRLHQG
ncbi:hypothetical protein ACFL0L_00270 [Patescibacteria group bacterium]